MLINKGSWFRNKAIPMINISTDKHDELRVIVSELCGELGFKGQIWDLRVIHPGLAWIRIDRPTIGFRVRIKDPLIGFKIIFNEQHDVHIQDMMSNTDLMTNLRHPMSINKIKSYIRNCKLERLLPKDRDMRRRVDPQSTSI